MLEQDKSAEQFRPKAMEFKYSTLIDPSKYETEGLCDVIDVHMHDAQAQEDWGAIKAVEEWKAHLGLAKSVHKLPGSLGPRFSFLSVAFPEMLPGRMELLAYFNEFIFLHDDVVEASDKTKGDELNDEARDVCLEDRAQISRHSDRSSVTKSMMSKISQEVLAIDPVAGQAALALWAEWFQKGAGRHNHTQFETLQKYLEYRILDAGKMYLTGVAIFAMGLRIPASELDILSPLCDPVWAAIGLTNDLFSFDKEKRAAQEAGESHVSNAVWVIMHEQSISEPEAKDHCREKIRENVAQYVETVANVHHRADLLHDARILVEALQYAISGTVVFTLDAPRYNPGKWYNDRQIGWLNHGTPSTVRKINGVDAAATSQSVL